MSGNPFKPSAGADPPFLVGRDDLIEDFAESIEDGPGAPMRLTVLTGPRGIGKTVVLNALGRRAAEEFQWLVIHDTATTGFIDRLCRAFTRQVAEEHGRTKERRLSGLSISSPIGGLGVQLAQLPASSPEDFREAITPLLDLCESNGTGVLVTLDEVHSDNSEELRQLAAAVQHLVREARQFAIAFACLPNAIDDLLADNQITFLRRAERRDLRNLPAPDVMSALRTTIEDNGRSITQEALELATAATGGYPFMVQLVGYNIWRTATDETITIDSAQYGIDVARKRLNALVHAPAVKELSEVDRAYLLAMLHDTGPSRAADIARRMGRTVQYVGVYRARLMAAGMIERAGHGLVRFAIPFLRDYLVEYANQHGLGEQLPVADRTPPI